MPRDQFIPALRFRSLTPLYDRICRLIGLGEPLRRFEVRALEGLSPARILEVGSGTGELLRAVARRFPGAELTGIDLDAQALALAEKKLRKDGTVARLVLAPAQALPFADATFDLVLSSLMLHHLPTKEKVRALREWRRVLEPHGALLLVDFGVPRSRLAKLLLWPMRFHIFEEQADNLRGRVPSMLTEAGFDHEEVGVYGSVIPAYRARARR
jgi:ubiquinone/menaquinone biosynthesis C-methylase UbiE